MRGFVMILMAIDHASQTWNAGRLSADSAYLPSFDGTGPMWIPGSPLDEAQFYTRWITHLCAPTRPVSGAWGSGWSERVVTSAQ